MLGPRRKSHLVVADAPPPLAADGLATDPIQLAVLPVKIVVLFGRP